MTIRLSLVGEQISPGDLVSSLQNLYKLVLADESRGIQFLAERYLAESNSKDQASLDQYVEDHSGVTELILIDAPRSDTKYLRVIVIPREGLIVDADEESRPHWQPLLDRLTEHLPYQLA